MKTASTRNNRADQTDNGRPTSDDPVLTGLRQAEAQYRKTYLILEQQTAEARRELDLARIENDALSHELALQRRDVEQERLHARHQRETANALAATLKEIHRSFLSGNIFDHILRACLALTGATRGLYVTGRACARAPVVCYWSAMVSLIPENACLRITRVQRSATIARPV